MRINQSWEAGLVREINHLCSSGHCSRNRRNPVAINLEEHVLPRLLRFAINQSSAMNEDGRGLGWTLALNTCNRRNGEGQKHIAQVSVHSSSYEIPRRNNKPKMCHPELAPKRERGTFRSPAPNDATARTGHTLNN